MNIMHKHTWKFYALIALVEFMCIFVLDMLIEGGYSHQILVHDLIVAVLFTVIFWLFYRKPFKKKK